jgi:gluconolactonase
MERSLDWAGYDVNHAWGEGGHNQKHATQIFPDVLRWLWRDWQTTMTIKANPKSESKWKGYEVVGDGEWTSIQRPEVKSGSFIKPAADGTVFVLETQDPKTSWVELKSDGSIIRGKATDNMTTCLAIGREGRPVLCTVNPIPKGNTDLWNAAIEEVPLDPAVKAEAVATDYVATDIAIRADGLRILVAEGGTLVKNQGTNIDVIHRDQFPAVFPMRLTWSPDQTLIYGSAVDCGEIAAYRVDGQSVVTSAQKFYRLQTFGSPMIMPGGLCVDTNGWLYVATSLGIQVLDQAGRVNFIIPTPKPALDVCFGGKDLSELFIACGDTIYKRPTKAKGIVSGQQPPIKPAAPKL